ncbi:unnamed protein product [Mytilus edulis]|uniref:DUF4371 domain-containing protein n=1 Tax=Mytilus edulis TaxID=6550 RepID=A0A8S3UET9_MYTED|nr:unnamed protein product [Mytilus edulis]
MTEDSSNKTQSETLSEEEAPQINCKLRSQQKGNLDDENYLSKIFTYKESYSSTILPVPQTEIQRQNQNNRRKNKADDVTDSSDIEQLGLVLRYLDNDNPVEKVIEYIECKSTTCESIAENILAKVQELGLSMKNCRSQSYDGAGNMSGKYNGCAARIKRLYPRAEYYYCMNHDLNLAVSKSCKVPEMQIMIESTKQLGIFFKYSPKRQNTLETSLTAVNNQRQQDGCTLIKCYKLKTLCETRWVERHTTLQNISHIYEAIVHCLTAITSRNTDCNWDTKSVTEASGLLMHITNSKWIVAINVYLHFSGYLRTLSVLLQGPTEDILSAFQKVSVVTNELKSIRESCDEAFCDVWENVNKMANLVGTEISIPRVCGRQTKRNNVSADTPQQYWMRTLFIPYVDHLIMEFGSRFTHASRTSTLALCLLPAHLTLLSNEKVDEIKEFLSMTFRHVPHSK